MLSLPVSSWLCRPKLHVFLKRMTRVCQCIPPNVNFLSCVPFTARVESAAFIGVLGALTCLVHPRHGVEFFENPHCIIDYFLGNSMIDNLFYNFWTGNVNFTWYIRLLNMDKRDYTYVCIYMHSCRCARARSHIIYKLSPYHRNHLYPWNMKKGFENCPS